MELERLTEPELAPAPPVREQPAASTTREILALLLGPPSARRFRVRLWDGEVEEPALADVAPAFTLVLRRPGALRRMLLPPSELSLAEAYLRGDADIEGSMEAATTLGDDLAARLRSPTMLARLTPLLLQLPRHDADDVPDDLRARGRSLVPRHTKRRDAAAIRHHYDVGNDFYQLFLDERMVYSCAYFPTGRESIHEAQRAKLDHICRKLRLRPGERLLDIGCGWGGLIMHAAREYGVDALGITLSERQAELARRRIAEAGLERRCRVQIRDYRDFPADVRFDKVVSVGMVEHVGSRMLPRYFAEAFRLTRPGGLFLNHGIVAAGSEVPGRLEAAVERVLWARGQFIERYVFPDGELVPIAEMIQRAEEVGFEVRDAEALREHYALTLRHWVRRLESRREDAERLTSDVTYRIWRLYMAASAHAFASGRLNIIQTLLARRDAAGRSSVPLTRDDIYHAGRATA